MQLKTRTWFLLSLLLFLLAGLFWVVGNRRAARERDAASINVSSNVSSSSLVSSSRLSPSDPRVGAMFARVVTNGATVSGKLSPTNRLAFQVTNTARPLSELVREERAVLLRNALID